MCARVRESDALVASLSEEGLTALDIELQKGSEKIRWFSEEKVVKAYQDAGIKFHQEGGGKDVSI